MHCTNVRLNSAIGCIAPLAKPEGRDEQIFEDRDSNLETARYESRGETCLMPIGVAQAVSRMAADRNQPKRRIVFDNRFLWLHSKKPRGNQSGEVAGFGCGFGPLDDEAYLQGTPSFHSESPVPVYTSRQDRREVVRHRVTAEVNGNAPVSVLPGCDVLERVDVAVVDRYPSVIVVDQSQARSGLVNEFVYY